MSGDFETLEINQPKIKYLKPEENTGWLDKLIKNIENMKKSYLGMKHYINFLSGIINLGI